MAGRQLNLTAPGGWSSPTSAPRRLPTPPAIPDQLFNWTLNLTSGLTDDSDASVDLHQGQGLSVGQLSPSLGCGRAAGHRPRHPDRLRQYSGSFSPHQGRLYVAYVAYVNFKNGPGDGIDNPPDNTDIFLAYSDNGGVSWVNQGQVNDDLGVRDGYTGAQPFGRSNNTLQTGRPQFMPKVAVDQATGTLVMSWKDVRDDASRSRSAVYVTASTDGGQTFNSQVFANPAKTATDAITLQTVALSPQPEQSGRARPGQHPGIRHSDGAGRLRRPCLSGLGRQLQPGPTLTQQCSRGQPAASLLSDPGYRHWPADHRQHDGTSQRRQGHQLPSHFRSFN